MGGKSSESLRRLVVCKKKKGTRKNRENAISQRKNRGRVEQAGEKIIAPKKKKKKLKVVQTREPRKSGRKVPTVN